MSKHGIFYLLTATEIMSIKEVLNSVASDDLFLFNELNEAKEILDSLKPLDTETTLRILEETKK